MKLSRFIFILALSTLCANAAYADSFGAGIAGGIVGAVIQSAVNAATKPRQPQVVERVVVVHEHSDRPVHHVHHVEPKTVAVPDASPVAIPQPVVIPPAPADPVVPANYQDAITDDVAAANIVKDFLSTVTGTRWTLAQSSKFAHIKLATYDYLVAEIEVNSDHGVQPVGFVHDIKTGQSLTCSMEVYHAFLYKGGNRGLLGLHDLNPLD